MYFIKTYNCDKKNCHLHVWVLLNHLQLVICLIYEIDEEVVVKKRTEYILKFLNLYTKTLTLKPLGICLNITPFMSVCNIFVQICSIASVSLISIPLLKYE